MKESFFWHVGTKDVLHVLFQTNLKPNDSDVKHCSLVKHSCFIFAKHWRTRNTVFDVRDSCCQRTALMQKHSDFCSVMSACSVDFALD